MIKAQNFDRIKDLEIRPGEDHKTITAEKTKQMVSGSVIPWCMILLLCVLLGTALGVNYYEKQIISDYETKLSSSYEDVVVLASENSSLREEVSVLGNQVQVLSETVNNKVASEAELTEVLAAQAIPTDFPLTGNATLTMADDNLACIFKASQGTTVVSSACGVVTSIVENTGFGNVIMIDHGNGYATIYSNGSDPMVKVGDTVSPGTTLFLIGKRNCEVVYQMQLDEEYINPLDVLEVNG